MEKKAGVLGARPISAARDRPEFGFSILEKGAHQRYSTNPPSLAAGGRPKPPEGPKTREGSMRRASSFSGKPPSEGESLSPADAAEPPRQAKAKKMRRPRTHPELLSRELRLPAAGIFPQDAPAAPANGSKLLVNVTVLQSIGALRVLVPKDATVRDVIKAALVLYAKEGRRPLLGFEPASFGLHYSQFSMDCLNPAERIEGLGSRNFFLCPKAAENGAAGAAPAAASCGTEVGQVSKIRDSWCRVMDCFLLLP